MIRRPPRSPLFPYTTLSHAAGRQPGPDELLEQRARIDLAALLARLGAQEIERGAVAHRRHEVVGEQHAVVQVERRSEEHTSELQSRQYLVCRLLFEK